MHPTPPQIIHQVGARRPWSYLLRRSYWRPAAYTAADVREELQQLLADEAAVSVTSVAAMMVLCVLLVGPLLVCDCVWWNGRGWCSLLTRRPPGNTQHDAMLTVCLHPPSKHHNPSPTNKPTSRVCAAPLPCLSATLVVLRSALTLMLMGRRGR